MAKITPRELTKIQKLDAVARVDAAREAGATIADAVGSVGISRQQYQRWRKGQGLGESAKKPGPKPVLELSEEEFRVLHYHAIRRESTRLAVEAFVKEPVCSEAHREVLLGYLDREAQRRRRVSWPPSVRRACLVTAEEKALHRGAKATGNVLPVGHRDLSWIEADGTKRDLRPGDLYESDDMSVNQPFRYVCPETRQEHHGRQMLFSQCVQSLMWLGASPLGRPRDGYRVEDIADHMLSIVEAWGLPLAWRLERGPWENNFINGFPLDKLAGGRFEGQRWGGLSDLFEVIRAYDSRGKCIEGSFNFLQDLIPVESEKVTAVDIGRKRGEFEKATRTMLRAGAGNVREMEKLWTIEQCAEGLTAAMQSFAMRPKERRAWGRDMKVPIELWQERPPKRELPDEDLWYFMPVKKTATVRQGQITTTAPHWKKDFVFYVNGIEDAKTQYLPHGLKVLIAFHPGRPELGCWVFNADVGSHNREGWRFREFLVRGTMHVESPQVDLRPREVREVNQDRKRASAAVRSEFRTIQEAGQREAAPRVSTARNGSGSAVEVAQGGQRVQPAARSQRVRDYSLDEEPRKLEPRRAPSADEVAKQEAEAMAANMPF